MLVQLLKNHPPGRDRLVKGFQGQGPYGTRLNTKDNSTPQNRNRLCLPLHHYLHHDTNATKKRLKPLHAH
ncbi:hypothetical protein N7527_006364 [Penicillium freii]|uniref:Uncharacterized protein n=1 Tax=Penicillium freii TaxID=48697 RepID=A0A101MAN6_PENFR|nr:hypothetical protein N7527_006364 [Penicillium freii]KUM57043.1 hypothetical protein ACN42_g10155 [Penicillium freii]